MVPVAARSAGMKPIKSPFLLNVIEPRSTAELKLELSSPNRRKQKATNLPDSPLSPDMSCCPPGSLGFLQSDYAHAGSCSSAGGTDIYAVGAPSASGKALIIIPDIYGWNGGRVRSVADYFASQGYYVVVPKLLVPCLREGTDGDGCPADIDFAKEFKPYMLKFPFETLKPKILDCMTHLQVVGAERVGFIGFCWGGWTMCHAFSSDEVLSSAVQVVGGAIGHPSITGIEEIFGGSPIDLVGKVRRPLLLLPASNDTVEYDQSPAGSIFTALAANNPLSAATRYADMTHGWIPRGDVADERTRRDVAAALEEMRTYFANLFEA